MQDIYAAIVGEPPTEQEKLATLAKKLRDQQMIGQLGTLTGDKVLAPMGAGMVEQAGEQAKTLGGYQARRRELDRQEAMARMNDEAQMARQLQRQEFDAGQNALQRALQLELEKMQQEGANSRATSAEAKAEAATKKELDRYVERYGKERDKAGLPELNKGIEQVDTWLNQYEGKAIPGIGFMDFSKYTSEEGSQIRQAVQAVENTILRALSGAAVTESEAARLKTQMFGPRATEASFLAGWSSLKERIAAKEANIDQSYDPMVVETFHSRGKKDTGAGAGAGAAAAPEGEISFEEFKRRRAAGEL